MTRAIITALLAVASIAGIAAPASAQTKYFARERIVGTGTGTGSGAAASPAYSCDPFVATTYVYDDYSSLGNATSEAGATTLCVNFMKTDKRSGYCMWDPRSSSYGVSFHPNARDVRTQDWISHKAAKCTAR